VTRILLKAFGGARSRPSPHACDTVRLAYPGPDTPFSDAPWLQIVERDSDVSLWSSDFLFVIAASLVMKEVVRGNSFDGPVAPDLVSPLAIGLALVTVCTTAGEARISVSALLTSLNRDPCGPCECR
jgi:hypothetical protein